MAMAVFLPVRQTLKVKRQIAEARAEEKRKLCSLLDPLAQELVAITGRDQLDPGAAKRGFKQMVAHIVAPRMGPDVRLSFFKYELAPRRLIFDEVCHGRNGDPDASVSYRRTNRPGKTVLEKMINANGSPLFVKNVRAPSPEENVEAAAGWATQTQYESFIAAGIRRVENKLHGMITLDTPNQETLQKEDAEILALVAHLVAAGFQAAEKKPSPPGGAGSAIPS